MQTLEEALAKAVAERNRLTVVISYLSEQLGVPVPNDSTGPTRRADGDSQPRVDQRTGKVDPLSLVAEAEFLGLSGPAAAIKVLEKVGRPHTLKTAVLVDALRKGGVPVKDAPTLYRSMIRNSKLQRVGRGLWGLSGWYPPTSRTPSRTEGAIETEPESEERPDEVA